MKKLLSLALGLTFVAAIISGCKDDTSDPITPDRVQTDTTNTTNQNGTTNPNDQTDTIQQPITPQTYNVTVKLIAESVSFENFTINISQDTMLTLTPNNDGIISAQLFEGKYNISASGKISEKGRVYNFSGKINDLEITSSFDTTQIYEINLDKVEKNQIIITEVYCGNSTYYDEKNEKNVTLQKDKYIKLYNNSDQPAEIKNFCFGICFPYMSNNTVGSITVTNYSAEGYTPATQGIWWIDEIKFEPYEEKVFVVYSAEDYTSLGGVNLDNSKYYCLIDMTSAFNQKSFYTEPSADKVKLNVQIYGLGNAWQIGQAPALFIFTTGEVSPADFANDAANQINLQGTDWGTFGSSLKIPNANIIDGVDIKNATCTYKNDGSLTSDNSTKYAQRLPDAVDKGFVNQTETGKGFSYYRNVDKDATSALTENEGKLVSGYSYGTETLTNGEGTASGSTDPSGIDAEASIKKGAHIIYQDTDNSSVDFHQRKQATLKD